MKAVPALGPEGRWARGSAGLSTSATARRVAAALALCWGPSWAPSPPAGRKRDRGVYFGSVPASVTGVRVLQRAGERWPSMSPSYRGLGKGLSGAGAVRFRDEKEIQAEAGLTPLSLSLSERRLQRLSSLLSPVSRVDSQGGAGSTRRLTSASAPLRTAPPRVTPCCAVRRPQGARWEAKLVAASSPFHRDRDVTGLYGMRPRVGLAVSGGASPRAAPCGASARAPLGRRRFLTRLSLRMGPRVLGCTQGRHDSATLGTRSCSPRWPPQRLRGRADERLAACRSPNETARSSRTISESSPFSPTPAPPSR